MAPQKFTQQPPWIKYSENALRALGVVFSISLPTQQRLKPLHSSSIFLTVGNRLAPAIALYPAGTKKGT
ncbi:MAG: hypothetical protein HOP34_13155 [Methylococcaceae bacterium]|nr:hypothetical protein [Methylococcaceae bacterium]